MATVRPAASGCSVAAGPMTPRTPRLEEQSGNSALGIASGRERPGCWLARCADTTTICWLLPRPRRRPFRLGGGYAQTAHNSTTVFPVNLALAPAWACFWGLCDTLSGRTSGGQPTYSSTVRPCPGSTDRIDCRDEYGWRVCVSVRMVKVIAAKPGFLTGHAMSPTVTPVRLDTVPDVARFVRQMRTCVGLAQQRLAERAGLPVSALAMTQAALVALNESENDGLGGGVAAPSSRGIESGLAIPT